MSHKGASILVYLDDINFNKHIKAQNQWHGAPLIKEPSVLLSLQIGHVPQEMISNGFHNLYYLDNEEETKRKV